MSKGKVLAEAELAWPTERVAVLQDDQPDTRATFMQAGWRLYSPSNGTELVEGVADGLRA